MILIDDLDIGRFGRIKDRTCNRLAADIFNVTIVNLDFRTGGVLLSKTVNSTAISYCIDEGNRKCLVVGTDDRGSREFPVAGGVKLHTRFTHEGKATTASRPCIASPVVGSGGSPGSRSSGNWARQLRL